MALTLEQFNEYQAIREHWRVNPVLYMQQRFGRDPTKQQRQFLEAIAQEGAKVSVRAGHGVGKTALWLTLIIGSIWLKNMVKIQTLFGFVLMVNFQSKTMTF